MYSKCRTAHRTGLTGLCAPSCRTRRAARQRLSGGRRAESAREHTRAAALQARHPGCIVYFGEAAQSCLAVTRSGPVGGRHIDEPLLEPWREYSARPLAAVPAEPDGVAGSPRFASGSRLPAGA
ncbi:hypothetical protein [Nocardiopsis sp. CNT312]|uniref:hypothetical protein n=1 Tax=Nocardiopsis sp. CNT312 TaxID=1137268 RepID=UPI0004B23340|nr:hypothetical protein [Nocardiopsis sp. CNT312]